MSDLAAALIRELDDAALDELAAKIDLSPASVDAVARRVVEIQEERCAIVHERELAARFVDAKCLAAILGVSPDAVYASADRLGAIRLGKAGSRRPRIVFDLWRALSHDEKPSDELRARDDDASEIPLLPIKG